MNTHSDMPDPASAHPVLTLEESARHEAALFGGDESLEWPAMQRAGRAIAKAVMCDFREIGKFPDAARVLVLAGKGHNGGDALIAAKYILEKHPRARVEVCFVFGERVLRPLAMRAWREIAGRVTSWSAVSPLRSATALQGYDLCLDGIFGFQFRPPVDARVAALIGRVNALPVRLRAAVDLPSGMVFRADFTYATGIVKTPVLENENSGRVRYLDLGFFGSSGTGDSPVDAPAGAPDMGRMPMPPDPHGLEARATRPATQPATRPCCAKILTPAILDPLRALRPAHCDKRDYGHLFIVGGSRKYPGAVLMSVLAALRSGAGLVTAFVPESLVPAFAAQAPEAIWCGMAESPGGGLALEDFSLVRERISETARGTASADALLLGPGMSRDREALTLALDIVRTIENIPLVLDADALQPGIAGAGSAQKILTPHAGEYQRIAAAIPQNAVVVRKGPASRIEHREKTYVSTFGGPVLARGGSGDLLAGMIGGLLAQSPREPLLAACRGAVWHGLAADCLARAHGQRAAHTTQLLDFLPEALRSASENP